MKKILIASAFFLCGTVTSSFSQTMNPALIAKAQIFTNEVFLNCPAFTDQVNVAANAEIMSRIEVVIEPYQTTETYKPLSAILLKNKCNPALTRDELNFNPSNFNPLKYFLNWYPTTITKYRVDNSNYVILVHPKP